MHTAHFWEVICFTFIHIVLCFAQHTSSPQADVIKHCENSTNSTTCSYTYEQLYKNLTKSENSFNISNALYPGRGKPSFLVKVNVFGPNKTSISTPANFTWSIHCLYATVPGCLLEVLSFWSILVTSRTQELNIQIPPFCCNVSDDKKKREEIIQEFLTRAVTELQDLAVIPGIRDPSLNTAECIRQGHKPTMDHTGRTAYIRAILFCSLFFAIFSGPLLAKYITAIHDVEKDNKIRMEKKHTAKAVCYSFNILSVVGIFVLTFAFVISCIYLQKGEATCDITAIITAIFAYSVALSIFITVKFCMPRYDDDDSYRKKCRLWMKCFLKKCFLIYGANAISYIFCWLIIGIRINLTWGLTIALFVICVSAALTYAIYLYLDNEATYTTGYRNISTTLGTSCDSSVTYRGTIDIFCCKVYSDRIQVTLFCVSGFLAVFLLFVIVVLAGKSYSGEEMAAEVLKTTSLYFISAFISWVTWKNHVSHHQSVQNTQNSTVRRPSRRHTF